MTPPSNQFWSPVREMTPLPDQLRSPAREIMAPPSQLRSPGRVMTLPPGLIQPPGARDPTPPEPVPGLVVATQEASQSVLVPCVRSVPVSALLDLPAAPLTTVATPPDPAALLSSTTPSLDLLDSLLNAAAMPSGPPPLNIASPDPAVPRMEEAAPSPSSMCKACPLFVYLLLIVSRVFNPDSCLSVPVSSLVPVPAPCLVHSVSDLSWSRHTNSLAKKAHQRLYHLRCLRHFRLPSKVLWNFYTCTIESILMGNITVWFWNSTKQDIQALQRVVRSAEHITHTELPELGLQSQTKARRIVKDPTHPNNRLFSLLRSGKRFRSLLTKTERLKRSFFPQAIQALNQGN
ncbi:hypothetical protein P4O66_002692 [Electrophorus voltai]|uniref:Alkylated DNA repair protein AlkB homologue 8 N-terminal domain-containing protein n=1 Tax=Electrophorus voltai TaxID=2609070 RepID=A0AAD9DQ44_9TELE|nr:hypothetical protein P4O66_002692 [Electrophorus voltai]